MAFRRSSYQAYRGRRPAVDPVAFVYAGLVSLVFSAACYFLFTGVDFLALLLLLVAAALFAYAGLSWLVIHSPFGNIALILKRVFEAAVLLGLLSFFIAEFLIVSGAKTDSDAPPADYLVIPGAGLRGAYPSPILQARLNGAYDYLVEHPDALAVVSGGMGPGETVTEASAMAAYLEAKGIDPARILQEPAATDTIQNVRLSLDIIRSAEGYDPQHPPAISILSNEFHVYRLSIIAKNEGADVSKLAVPTPVFALKVLYHVREYFSLLKVFLYYL